MQWPLPQEFNEAVQNPGGAFADPDLRAGLPVVGPHGLPLPHSGNYADVYQFLGPDGRSWAVKCFTRPVSGLEERYAAVTDALAAAALPFGVAFTFLAEGVRVRGTWRPIVKMEWVEGRPLNQIVEENLGRPVILGKLAGRWAKLCRRLREAGIAHADIQHGNVMLVPGSKPGAYGLKLVDYDGMYVPTLANSPSGEAGHPNFQHPDRLASRAYSPDLDRFPHLVIATALKALEAGGPDLWGRYDNGDNLLFCEADFKDPSASGLMRQLWGAGNPAVRALVGRLAVACGRPIPETPWLDDVAPEGEPAPLDPATEREATQLLGLTESAPVVFDDPGPAAPAAAPAFEVAEEEPAPGLAVGEQPGEVPPEPEATEPEPQPPYEQQYEPEPEPEPEYEEPEPEPEQERHRPRPRDWRPAARRRPGRGRNKRTVTVAAVLGVLFAAAAAVAGVLVVAVKRSEVPEDDGPGTTNLVQGPGPRPNTPGPPPNEPRQGPKFPSRNPIVPPSDPARPADPAILPRLTTRWEVPAGGPLVSRMVVTDDGKWLAAAAYGRKEVAVYDLQTGAPAAVFKGHDTPVLALTRLPGGRVASLAADQDFALVWNPATGDEVGKLPIPALQQTQPEPFLSASTNGKYLLSGGTESDNWQPARTPRPPVTLTSTDTGRPVFSFRMSWGIARFMNSSQVLAADDKAGQMRVFRTSTGELIRQGKVESAIEPALAIAVCPPNGGRVVYLGNTDRPADRRYYVYDTATWQRVQTLPVKPTAGFRTKFSPDGQWLYLVHQPGGQAGGTQLVLLRAWTPAAVAEVGDTRGVQWDHGPAFGPGVLAVPKAGGGIVAFEIPTDAQTLPRPAPKPAPPPDEKQPIPQSPAGEVDIRTLPRLRVRWERPKGGATPHLMAFTDDGRWAVVTAKARPEIGLFDAVTGKLVPRPFAGHARGNASSAGGTNRALGVAPLPGGEVLSIAAEQDFALVWNPITMKVKRQIDCPVIPAGHNWSFLQTSPDGKYFAAGGTTRMDPGEARPAPPPVAVTEVATGKKVLSVSMNWGVARFTADSARLVVAHDRTGRIQVYRLATGEVESEAWAPVENEDTVPIAVSPDGKHVAYVCTRRLKGGGPTAYVCDAATGRHVATLPITRPDDLRTDFSPDGKWLAVVAKPDTIGRPTLVLVSTATWAPVAAIPTGDTGVFRGDLNLRFSPDGTALGLPRAGGDTVVFDLPRGAAGGKGAWDHVRASGGPAGNPAEVVGDIYRVTGSLETRETFDGPFECSAVVRLAGEKLRLHGPGGAEVTFSSAAKRKELLVRRTDAKGRSSYATGRMPALAPDTWYTFRWRMTATQITVWIDSTPVFEENGGFDLSAKAAVKLSALDQPVEVKSFTAKAVK